MFDQCDVGGRRVDVCWGRNLEYVSEFALNQILSDRRHNILNYFGNHVFFVFCYHPALGR